MIKNAAIQSFFIIEKIKKYRKCPALIRGESRGEERRGRGGGEGQRGGATTGRGAEEVARYYDKHGYEDEHLLSKLF